jgi:hypothetical protein
MGIQWMVHWCVVVHSTQCKMDGKVNAQYGGSLFKIIVFHKIPHSSVKFFIFCGTIG